ncbi:MAG TPA: YkvA family protein [Pirellulales bacterium]|nr:YkvA family protein [Pirellulales bacterium]
MESFFDMLKTLMTCLTVLGIAWVVALSLPKSKARAVINEVVSWAFLAFCAFYAISPIDVLPEAVLGPFGFIDDLGSVFLGYQGFKSAMSAREERKYLD